MADTRLRYSALDGLRGLAVLAVIVNHVPLMLWNAQAPSWLEPFLAVVQASGKTGVTTLFMLTGFLMSWLYPQPDNPLKFWARRYARLFPPFLVMVVGWSFIINLPKLSLFAQALIVLGVAVAGRLLWELGLRLAEVVPLKKWLLIGFIGLQAMVAIWYVFGLQRVPAAVFYTVWQPWLQQFTSVLINGTLTLPFGQYIAQLDGVYWSLVAEVAFYLLYPTVMIPLIQVVKKSNLKFSKLWLLASLFPFFIALKYVAEHLLGMSLLIPQLSIFFVAGVLIGQYKTEIHQWLKSLPIQYSSATTTQFLVLLIASHVIAYKWLLADWHVTWQLLTVVPMSYLLALLTLPSLSETRWLTPKWLLWLGKYSYSLYLTHSLVVRWLEKIIPPNTVPNTFLLIGSTIGVACAVSWCLYALIEAPYFALRKKTPASASKLELKVKKQPVVQTGIVWGFMTAVIVIVYLAFRPPVSLFTYVDRVGVDWGTAFWQPTSPQIILPEPIEVKFRAPHSNFGMIMTSISSRRLEDNPDIDAAPWPLDYRLSSGPDQLADKTFFVHEIGSSHYHPFGFALLPDSQGKEFALSLQVDRKNRSFEAKLLRDEGQALLISFVDKKTLLKQPAQLVQWSIAKVGEPLANPAFWRTFLLMLPTLALLALASMSVRKKSVAGDA